MLKNKIFKILTLGLLSTTIISCNIFAANELPKFEKAKVTKVIDGDTIEINEKYKVRLVGVNTPESTTKTEKYGKEASSYTKKALLNETVYLEKDVSDTDKYGRLLRLVWLEEPKEITEKEIRSKMYNAKLVLDGYAEPSTYAPDVKYADYFREFGREARKKEKGLWKYGPDGTTKGDDLEKPTPTKSPSKTTATNKSNSTVYYVTNGKVYHSTKSCKTLKNSKTILQGKLQDVIKKGKINPCKVCK